VPLLSLASVEISNASVSPQSRLIRPRAHPWHFSITYIKLCLNMPLRFSLSSRLPAFFLGLLQSSEWCGCRMWPRSWRLGLEAVSRRSSASARSRLGVGTPRPRLGFELWRPGLGLASVSTKKASSASLQFPRYIATCRMAPFWASFPGREVCCRWGRVSKLSLLSSSDIILREQSHLGPEIRSFEKFVWGGSVTVC